MEVIAVAVQNVSAHSSADRRWRPHACLSAESGLRRNSSVESGLRPFRLVRKRRDFIVDDAARNKGENVP
jgi:hypothetical protein